MAVVGAGPAGCMAARYAARAGASTLLLEEHSAVGWPVQCAGLLGTEALAEAELPGGPYILQEVRGARIFSPGGSCLGFRAPSSRAFVIDRRLFDRALALEAVRAGAELHLRSGVRRMGRVEGGRLLALSDGSEIQARVVISAEGVRARLARQAGIAPPQRILSGAQFLLPFAVEDPERVEVHLGEAPGLFAWVIPVGDGQARIGLCAEDGALLRLEAFIRKERISERI
ncbi:MAG: NAD(P)/FAD-dependent oxidoreductase, partial [Methanothrix sp.]|nr:NAD(P)/FAD-dependent oxidoreductase [Methanothrix sp.]